MSVPLLQTKLNIPSSPNRYGRLNLVSRPRLLDKLQTGFACKLTLLCAPAGFGKSTLVTEWIRHNTGNGLAANSPAHTPYAVAWLSLDDGDNDPIRFWSYFVAALQSVNANIGITTLALLESPQPLAPEMLLTPLLNDLAT